MLLALSCDLSTPGMNMEGLVKHPPVTGKEPAQRLCPPPEDTPVRGRHKAPAQAA